MRMSAPTVTWPRPDILPAADTKLVVVEASAGTGKTYFLEHRVVDLVLAGAPLEQILVVTFTDKATAELRTRIRDLVDRISRADGSVAVAPDAARSPSWMIDQPARERLAAALAGFDHAPIFTIHGFCQRVLIEDAFAARRLFEQTRIADEIAFADAFAVVLRGDFARDPRHAELLGAYLEAGGSVAALQTLLLRCARADAPVRDHVELATIVPLIESVLAELGTDEARARVFDPIKKLTTQNKNWARKWTVEVIDTLAALDLTLPPARLLGKLGEARARAAQIAGKLRDVEVPPSAGRAIRALAALTSIDTAVAGTFLPIVLAQLGLDKAERGLFDYSDMLRLVGEALHGTRGAELAARLRTRMPWVLIDEFQDTDKVQWDIFRTVWLHPDARGLTIVGDPKQAIYSFRGADVHAYVGARDELLAAGAQRVALTVNRRSTAPLVDAVNALLRGNGLEPLLHGEITYDEPVTAGGGVTCASTLPAITVFTLTSTGKPAIDPQRAALTGAIGRAIEALRAAPPVWHKGDATPAFELRHVMVLTRTNNEATEIATALRGRGLPCALVESDKLFATREAADLAAVLGAIAAPRDRSARMRALRSRFFDVPWAELAAVVDAPDHHPAIARLFEWAALASRRAYELLFRRLVEDSRFAERALVLGGGERAITNTWHVIELLLEEVARARSDLHELVTRLRGWIVDTAQRTDERDTQRAETDADAIRVLTVHKAKGLEAPYVFLYGLSGQSPPSNVHTIRGLDGRAIVIGNEDGSTKEQRLAEQAAENQRLAYVALTRAQVRMYLPRYAVNLASTSAYVAIQPCLDAVIDPKMDAATRDRFGVVTVSTDDDPPREAAPDALARFDPPAPPTLVPLAPIDATRAGLTLISYTRLAHEVDAATVSLRHPRAGVGVADELGADELATDDAVGTVAADELPPGAASGLLLHDVLEVVDLAGARAATDAAGWAREPAVAAALADAARARGVDAAYLPHAARVAHRALTAPLALGGDDVLPALVDATALAREVEFEFPFPRGLVKGYLDALVVWGDELWVLDYKSDLLATADQVAAERRVDERYSIQARLYVLAAQRLAGSRRLAGMLFAFIRHGITVPVRVDAEQLAAWTTWLDRLEVA